MNIEGYDEGYSYESYDRYIRNLDNSTTSKIQTKYWHTKQLVIKKLGKKEDEHVIAGDADVDTKLEVFHAIQMSCMDLLRALEHYQDAICAISQEENTTGRFLKEYSQQDKSRAGKMMAAVGKTFSSAAQQRLTLRPSLVRLYQEVETFRYQAISDCLMTINRMESVRTEYRASLLWMQDISKELDPDTYKQLEKFRKVQAQVKVTKERFDRLKNDVCQKIDMLGASRCNMLSHTLAQYQSTLLHFWEKTSKTMSAILENFKGYQHYEFTMLKDLTEPSKKVADEVNKRNDPADESCAEEAEEASELNQADIDDDDKLIELLQDAKRTGEFADGNDGDDELLMPLGHRRQADGENVQLGENRDQQDDDFALLNEILNAPSTGGDEFTQQWQATYGMDNFTQQTATASQYGQLMGDEQPAQFMPSHLLDLTSNMGAVNMNDQNPALGDQQQQQQQQFQPQQTMHSTTNPYNNNSSAAALLHQQAPSSLLGGLGPQPRAPGRAGGGPGGVAEPRRDMSAWFSLFADLDPLANPDAVGTADSDQNELRNC